MSTQSRLAGLRWRALTGLVVGIVAACTDAPVAPAPDVDIGFAVTFNIGDRVKTTGNVNVRNGPYGRAIQLGTQPVGALGYITGGPVIDVTGDGLLRWKVNFDTGVDGWVADLYAGLVLIAPASVGVASVTVTPATASIPQGMTTQLSAVAKDSAGNVLSSATMVWYSTDTLKAKVSTAGLVTAVAVGSASVIATSGSRADTTPVTVTPVPVATVTVSPATATAAPGGTVQLSATLKDSAGNTLTGRAIAWSSGAAGVAAVSTSGLVTGVAAGSATITATSEGKSGTAAITVTTTTQTVTGYFVAPNGSSSAAGTIASPLSLAAALSGAGGKIRPGDTVWVRGGTYPGAFRSTVAGTAGQPVVFRQYPGERAIIDAAGATGDQFVVAGAWTVFWGLEFMNSNTARTTTSTANNWRPNLLVNNASHTKYINLVIHDGGVAFYNYPSQVDVEIYGTVMYNNGWQGPDRGHGHALYLKSYSGPVVVRDNVMFNQFGYGVHIYTNAGSGQLNNMRLEGNVAFNNGTLSTNSSSANILLGGADYATGDVLTGNLTYFSPSVSGANVKIGYGTLKNGSVVVDGNLFVGGSPVLDLGYWTSATVAGNTLVGGASVLRQNDAAIAGLTWSVNVHRRDPVASAWWYSGSSRTFSGWRTASGIGATDQVLSGTPTTAQVIVRPNLYEPGRATVIVYNWNRQGSVLADVAGALVVGKPYEVRNVQALSGPAVASGTYVGGAISIPVTGVTPPAPIGMASSRAPRTGPDFDVFIVTQP